MLGESLLKLDNLEFVLREIEASHGLQTMKRSLGSISGAMSLFSGIP
jgi:hypothetical protein